MGNNKQGTSVWKVIGVILLLIILGIGAYLVWKGLGAAGWVKGPDELKKQLDETLKENEQLKLNLTQTQEERDAYEKNVKGVPEWFFWVIIGAVLLVAILMILLYGQVDGANINREQAKKIAREVIEEEWGWKFFLDDPDWGKKWVKQTVKTGQAVDGDADAIWYIVSHCEDYPEGGNEPPDHLSITVLIKSNDADRQITVEPGLNAKSAAKKHGIKLQRSPRPSDLAQELAGLEAATKVTDVVKKLKEAEDE